VNAYLPDTVAIEFIVPALIEEITLMLAAVPDGSVAAAPTAPLWRWAQWPGPVSQLIARHAAADARLRALRAAATAGTAIPAQLLFSAEVLDRPRARWPELFTEGHTGCSPAATAAALAWTGSSPQAVIEYLAASRADGDGGALAHFLPMATFERSWIVANLARLGLPVGDPLAGQLAAYFTGLLRAGAVPMGPGLPADADITAVMLFALHSLGAHPDPGCLLDFEREHAFVNYPSERTASTTTNAHVLEALTAWCRRSWCAIPTWHTGSTTTTGTFDKGGPLIDRGRELFGDSLTLCRHAQHRRQRGLVQPAFTKARLPGYAAVMTSAIGALADSWNTGDAMDVRAEMRAFTARVSVATLFGGSLSDADQQQALRDLSALLSGTNRRMFLPPSLAALPFPGNRSYNRARARLRQVLAQLIADYRRTGTDHGDALSMLLAAHGDGIPRLTDTEITDQLVILFTAGADTTANTLSWALYLLARHPEAERRLHQEVDVALAGWPATFADLGNLDFTGHVITETLRLYPAVPLATREVVADTELGGHPIAAGTILVLSPISLQYRPELFASPGQFDPARWSDVELSPLRRKALTPFGAGARKCIGDSFGMTMATLALASITARWTFTPLTAARVRPVLQAVLMPKNLRMVATARRG
jgi:cytochrome P450